MAKIVRWSNKRFDDYIAEHAPGYTRLGEVGKSIEHVLMSCTANHRFSPRLSDFVHKQSRCPDCTRNKPLDADQVFHYFRMRGYEPLEPYTNSYTKMELRCPNGSVYRVTYANFKTKGSRCSCALCIEDNRKKAVSRTHADLEKCGFKVLGEWKNTKTKVLAACTVCGHQREVLPSNYIYYNAKCVNCTGYKRYTPGDFEEMLKHEEYTLLSEVTQMTTKVRVQCNKQHESYMVSPSFFMRGVRCRFCAIDKRGERIRGKNHPFYDVNISEVIRQNTRNLAEYNEWRRVVLERDKHRCQNPTCTREQPSLVVHHLVSWEDNVDLRFDVANGLTLCAPCHLNFHSKYGNGHNTAEQYRQWVNNNKIRKHKQDNKLQYKPVLDGDGKYLIKLFRGDKHLHGTSFPSQTKESAGEICRILNQESIKLQKLISQSSRR